MIRTHPCGVSHHKQMQTLFRTNNNEHCGNFDFVRNRYLQRYFCCHYQAFIRSEQAKGKQGNKSLAENGLIGNLFAPVQYIHTSRHHCCMYGNDRKRDKRQTSKFGTCFITAKSRKFIIIIIGVLHNTLLIAHMKILERRKAESAHNYSSNKQETLQLASNWKLFL